MKHVALILLLLVFTCPLTVGAVLWVDWMQREVDDQEITPYEYRHLQKVLSEHPELAELATTLYQDGKITVDEAKHWENEVRNQELLKGKQAFAETLTELRN